MRRKNYFLTLFILIFLALPAIAFDSDSQNDDCSGELLDKLDGITSTATFIGNGKLNKLDFHDYYYFTPGVKGTYTITLDAVVADIKAGISCDELVIPL